MMHTQTLARFIQQRESLQSNDLRQSINPIMAKSRLKVADHQDVSLSNNSAKFKTWPTSLFNSYRCILHFIKATYITRLTAAFKI